MSRFRHIRRLVLLAVIAGGAWFFVGRGLMELEWTDLDFDSTSVADARQDLAAGRTGPRLKTDPCMRHQSTIDMNLRLDGPFPVAAGREIAMEVVILSDTLMVDRLYLGPPTRHLVLAGLPVCLPSANLPRNAQEDAAFGRLIVDFVDMTGNRYVSFGGEDAFPVFLWRRIRVDWSVIPWLMEGTESLSNIMVTPEP